jgi:proton-dependent oligopeptide transporter, POT family
MPALEVDDLNLDATVRRPSVAAIQETKGGMGRTSEEMGSDTTDITEPTMEEMKTLRRISGPINWQMMTVTFVEFCERFSYYGTTAVFVNFIQQGRPYGSRTGNIQDNYACISRMGRDACLQPGGLDQDQQAATGLTTFNQFWAYIMPLVGGYIADTYLGRYLTIQYAILAAILGHIILICSSIPSVMDNPNGALGCFAVGLVIMGIGTGGFKSNVSPLLAEQIKQTRPEVVTLSSGERVIRDPQVTISRVYLYFYMMVSSHQWNRLKLTDTFANTFTDQRWLSFRRYWHGLCGAIHRFLAFVCSAHLCFLSGASGLDRVQEVVCSRTAHRIRDITRIHALAHGQQGQILAKPSQMA